MRRLLVPALVILAHASHALPALSQPQGEPRLQPPPRTQVVVLTNRSGVSLERRAGSADLLDGDGSTSHTASLWARVCTAPCRATLDPGEQLRIAGDEITPSSPFSLDPRSPAVRIDANAGSRSALTLGKTFVSTGLGLMALGTIMLVIPASGDDPSSASAFKTLHGIGYGALGVGSALTLSGIPLWIINGTTVTLSSTASTAGNAKPTAWMLGARRTLF